MKIGIITYHNAINYGAVLQAYALSLYLNCSDIQAEIIDYRCPAVEAQYALKSMGNSSSVLNFLNHNISCFFRHRKKKRFAEFLSCMPLSRQITRDQMLLGLPYDVVIVGSDQVFNPICNRSDTSYLLDFAQHSLRYSYAASMGSVAQFKTFDADTKHLLEAFDGISLREQDAADYLSDLIGRKCITVVDPVWLLGKEEWGKVLSDRPFIKKPYIFVYNLMDFSFMREYVLRLAKLTGLQVVAANRTIRGDCQYFTRAKIASCVGPEVFLNLIRNSNFFVTDSFHGATLSVILEKRFAVALDPGSLTTNSRFSMLLNELGLYGQVISAGTDPYENVIDFDAAKSVMDKKISFSKQYIDQIMRKERIN